MRNFNENTITDAVLERIKDATDPRIKHHPAGRAPDGRMVDGDYFHLNYDFGLKQLASNARAA